MLLFAVAIVNAVDVAADVVVAATSLVCVVVAAALIVEKFVRAIMKEVFAMLLVPTYASMQ